MKELDENRLKDAVVSTLGISAELYGDQLSLGDCPAWDSLGHMNLVYAIEAAFDVRFESDDIPELKSIAVIKRRLAARAAADGWTALAG